MIEQYALLLSQCRTLNEANRALIIMNNEQTPTEALQTHELLSRSQWRFPTRVALGKQEQFFGGVRREIERSAQGVREAEKSFVEPFHRRRINDSLALFSDGKSSDDKTLLIGFAGNAARLMMPTPIFLQHLDAARVDLALLTDLNRDGYRSGTRGAADSLQELIAALPGILSSEGYRRIAVIGTSGGGLPAVVCGLSLRARSILAAGANGPDDERWNDVNGESGRQLLERGAASSPDSQVTLVFGAQSPRDQEAAEALARLVPARLVAVSDPEGEVGHGALFPLVGQKRLAGFLSEYLGL